MDQSVLSGRAVRSIMNGQCIGVPDDVVVPFSRDELIVAREEGQFLFFLPRGSFASPPPVLKHNFVHGDIEHERHTTWVREEVAPHYVLTSVGACEGTQNLPLWEQKKRVQPHELLSPYEIACAGLLYKQVTKELFFAGKVRTAYEFSATPMHLHSYPLTAILAYDQNGKIRLSKGYASQVGEDLGVCVGTRRLAL